MEEQAKKSFIINVIFIVFWAVLIIFAVKFCLRYLFPFILAGLVATLMQKPAKKISKKGILKKGTVAAILSVVTYLLVAALVVFLVVKLFDLTGAVINNFSDIGKKVSDFLLRTEESFDKIFLNVPAEIRDGIKKVVTDFVLEISQKIAKLFSSFAAGTISFAPNFIFTSVVALAATCYIAKDYEGLTKFIKDITPEKTMKSFLKIKDIFKTCIFKMFTGYVIIMFLTFLEIFIGLLFLGVKNAVSIAALISFVDILPVLGAGVILIPWGLINVLLGNTVFGVLILLLYLVITFVRNLAEPKIVGGTMGINPLFMLLAMFLGLRIFSFAGLIILPVTFIVIVKYYKSEMV